MTGGFDYKIDGATLATEQEGCPLLESPCGSGSTGDQRAVHKDMQWYRGLSESKSGVQTGFDFEKTPGSSVLQRGMTKMSMKYLRKIIRRLVWRFRQRGLNVAFDSTGIGLRTSSHWFDIRIRRVSRRRDHMKHSGMKPIQR